jgi:hypothetical protein
LKLKKLNIVGLLKKRTSATHVLRMHARARSAGPVRGLAKHPVSRDLGKTLAGFFIDVFLDC